MNNYKSGNIAIFLTVSILTISACQLFSFQSEDTTPGTIEQTLLSEDDTIIKAEVFFWVNIPENTPAFDNIQLVIYDEVTGLPLNPTQFTMQSLDETNLGIALQFRIGSVVKYAYIRNTDEIHQEYTLDGAPVRYRTFYVDGAGEVHDIISRWDDTTSSAVAGRIIGEAVENGTGLPIPNLLIIVGGKQVLTASDGSFLVSGLNPGTHQVTGLSLDGNYLTAKHNATIAPEAATPVSLRLNRTSNVNVKFTITVPENTLSTVPLRLAGNLSQLGNTYNNLGGGISGLPEKMPILEKISDNQYQLNISLPTETDIRYKFTQGDGFWNAEHGSDNRFLTRQLVIPRDISELNITETVVSWQTGSEEPIWFDVEVPTDTPPTDKVFLQLKLFDWMSPIPMWSAGINRWVFRIVGPTNIPADVQYRYCRNGFCGDENLANAIPPFTINLSTSTEDSPLLTKDIVSYWPFTVSEVPFPVVLSNIINPRQDGFIAGVEFSPQYKPNWDSYSRSAITDIQNINANTIIFSPTWKVTSNNPPAFQQTLGEDIAWSSLKENIQLAQKQGYGVYIYPRLSFEGSSEDWWNSATLDLAWWLNWADQYRRFILHHADLAQRLNISGIIIGGDYLENTLNDNELWTGLLDSVRVHFQGDIAWKLSQKNITTPPQSLQQVDIIIVSWGAKLGNSPNASVGEMQAKAELLLDSEVWTFFQQIQKPILLSAAYHSIDGSNTNCITDINSENICLSSDEINLSNTLTTDLQEQVEIYNALLAAVNDRDWIQGFITEGYFSTVGQHDYTTSIHGKPAEEVLGYWFRNFLGK